MSTFNCSVVPTETATDAGVAGAGVLLSFIITAGISLLFSTIIILTEFRTSSHSTRTTILRKILLSLSDQQVITGIGIQCVGLAKMSSIVPYHFFIIWMLSLLSTCTHISTLFALSSSFKRDWVLRWLRQFFMFVNLVLSCVSGIFVLMSVMKNLEPTLPIACVWDVESRGAPGNAGISIAGTIAVLAGQCIFFALGVWYLHVDNAKWIKFVQGVGILSLVALGVGAAVRVVLLSQAFGTPSVKLEDEGEKDWGFGQLLTLLLLILPLISMVEILRGEMRIPAPVPMEGADALLGKEHELGPVRQSFQPNPFWGKGEERSRFSKW